MAYRLKPEYIRRITDDGELYGKVAKKMKITGPSLAVPLRKNSKQLSRKEILELLSEYLGVPENDLIEEIEESETV